MCWALCFVVSLCFQPYMILSMSVSTASVLNFTTRIQNNCLVEPSWLSLQFKIFRKAFDSTVLNPTSLQMHSAMLQEEVQRLSQVLGHAANTGQCMDITGPMADLSMDAIGYAAFGMDLGCLSRLDQVLKSGSDNTKPQEVRVCLAAHPCVHKQQDVLLSLSSSTDATRWQLTMKVNTCAAAGCSNAKLEKGYQRIVNAAWLLHCGFVKRLHYFSSHCIVP